jgi:hypothetical protein
MSSSAHRTQLRTISMIFTFDNKFDQIDEADYMFIFQIKHQYYFWIIAHILLLRVLKRFSWPRFSHSETVNKIHFPYLDLSQNVKIRDVPYSLKSPRNSECKLAHIYDIFQVQLSIGFCLQIWKPVVCNIQQLYMNNFLPRHE